MSVIADIDEFMYDSGIDVLHPGGLAKTEEMALACAIAAGSRVLDIGVGRGASACFLARKYDCRVTGIDTSERMVRASRSRARREGLEASVEFQVADACSMPFEDGSFDVVMAECVTTLVDKPRALREMVRVTRAGGHVGDLEMTWRREPPDRAVRETYELWGGYQTMTLPQWRALFERMGLEEVTVTDFSETLADMEAEIRQQLGLWGEIRMAAKLAFHRDLIEAMLAYRKLFQAYIDYIGYGYFVGRKPEQPHPDR